MSGAAALFAPGEVVRSGRVCLSALTPEAMQEMSAWLPAALAPEWTPDDLLRAAEGQGGVLVSDAQGGAAGVALIARDTPARGDATFGFFSIEPSRRFRGVGGEAGLALERHLRARLGLRRVFAPVPEARGLAVYFWLRLGYRPLSAAEGPGPLFSLATVPLPGIWMLRDAA